MIRMKGIASRDIVSTIRCNQCFPAHSGGKAKGAAFNPRNFRDALAISANETGKKAMRRKSAPNNANIVTRAAKPHPPKGGRFWTASSSAATDDGVAERVAGGRAKKGSFSNNFTEMIA